MLLSKKSQRRMVEAAILTSLLAVGAVAAPTATAYTDSAPTNTCYIRLWNTAWDARCTSATVGRYNANVDYSSEPDYHGNWKYLPDSFQGSFDNGQATFGVSSNNTYVGYRG